MNFNRIGIVPYDDQLALQVAPSSLTQILVEIQYLIVSGGYYSTSQCFVTIDPDPWPSLAGPFVSVHPGHHRLIPEQWAGAGAYLAGYRGSIKVRIADQCRLDYAGRDDAALLRPIDPGRTDAGLIDRAQQLAEFLTSEKTAVALTKTGLVETPLSPGSISDPKPRKGDPRWRAITLELGFDWVHVYNRGQG